MIIDGQVHRGLLNKEEILPKMTTKMVKKQDALCTVDELMDIITAETGGMVVLPSSSYDEVYEGIFIGDE